LALQTNVNFELIIVDDGVKFDSSKDVNIDRIIRTLGDKYSIKHKYIKNSSRQGLAVSRNIASDNASEDIVIKLDDDHFCDSRFIEHLVNTFEVKLDAGCVGSVFPFVRDGISVCPLPCELFGDLGNDPKWEDKQLRCYPSWSDDIVDAITVRGIMAYRKDEKIRHNEELTEISHREDTIFSLEYLNHEYKNYVNVRAIAYHLYANDGGCRSFKPEVADQQRKKDERIYNNYLQENTDATWSAQ
jgi:glycosyltransferase involved in cell wall biosynthesis